jgi:hypothetical protein
VSEARRNGFARFAARHSSRTCLRTRGPANSRWRVLRC